MKKLLVKVVAFITAAAVMSGGFVYADDFGSNPEDIAVIDAGALEFFADSGYDSNSYGGADGITILDNGGYVGYDGAPLLGGYSDYSDDTDELDYYGNSDSEIMPMAQSGDFEYEILSDGTVSLTKYLGNGSEVNIPESIAGRKVTVIGQKCFYEKYSVKKCKFHME